MERRTFLSTAPAALVVGTAPARVVHFVVAYAPDGPVDLVVRLIGDRLATKFGQSFVTGNMPGANGAIGVQMLMAVSPDVPTMAEAGYRDFDLQPWTGFFGPANLDKSIVSALSVAMKEILARPDVAERLAGLAKVPAFNTPEKPTAMISRSIALWKEVAARTMIVVE